MNDLEGFGYLIEKRRKICLGIGTNFPSKFQYWTH